ncbi:Guanylate cyclase 32E [Dufourea novaeangliae]|uniref:Guanylate cyclase 32E n=1 Tax=Dufourea novaeangliae TaxID=178035 RepID=A0A154PCU8_DUFNO|nr:Guanylate cyclase 32E [Dufourea novaeangliae]
MRPGPPVQPSRRRPPRRQELHQERNRRHRQDQPQPLLLHSRPLGSSSSRALLVLLLLASSPLVLGLAEPPGLPGAEWQQAISRQTYPKSSFGRTIQPRKQQNLTIGYLTAIKGGLKDRQGLAISGAFSMALDEINNDPNILPNVKLVMRWSDTRGETVEATKAMIDMICDGVAAFFGPEGSCYVEAIVAQSRNIPMISYTALAVGVLAIQARIRPQVCIYGCGGGDTPLIRRGSTNAKQDVNCNDSAGNLKCSDYKASKVNTFARTEPPDTQVTKSVIALLLHYGWNKFTIITESAWSTVARSLEEQATKNNLTLNHYKTVEDRHTCCEERLPCCQVSVWFQLIQETKNMTRSQSNFHLH